MRGCRTRVLGPIYIEAARLFILYIYSLGECNRLDRPPPALFGPNSQMRLWAVIGIITVATLLHLLCSSTHFVCSLSRWLLFSALLWNEMKITRVDTAAGYGISHCRCWVIKMCVANCFVGQINAQNIFTVSISKDLWLKNWMLNSRIKKLLFFKCFSLIYFYYLLIKWACGMILQTTDEKLVVLEILNNIYEGKAKIRHIDFIL
jgi:hypothetical protein